MTGGLDSLLLFLSRFSKLNIALINCLLFILLLRVIDDFYLIILLVSIVIFYIRYIEKYALLFFLLVNVALFVIDGIFYILFLFI